MITMIAVIIRAITTFSLQLIDLYDISLKDIHIKHTRNESPNIHVTLNKKFQHFRTHGPNTSSAANRFILSNL